MLKGSVNQVAENICQYWNTVRWFLSFFKYKNIKMVDKKYNWLNTIPILFMVASWGPKLSISNTFKESEVTAYCVLSYYKS